MQRRRGGVQCPSKYIRMPVERTPIRRVPAPVPLYEKESPNFHYENPNLWQDSEGTTARTVDEFFPRARIEDVIREVGPIDVKEKEHMDEWSVNNSVNDKNDTLNKMLAHVDDIVEKYTGEDLRQVVEAEFKRRYTMLVKAYLAKKARAVAKENKLSKIVDEIDWCNKIQSGTLDKMYVSQLDMHLEKVAGSKKSIIQEKGFSKAKKVEAVKRHYYSCNNHILTTSTQELRQPQTLCQPLQPLPPTQPKLVVIPWGGQTILLGTSVSLTNTCPIDNSLMILHSLTNESVKIRS